MLILRGYNNLGVVLGARRVNLYLLPLIAIEAFLNLNQRIRSRSVRQGYYIVVLSRLEVHHRLAAQVERKESIYIRTLHFVGNGIEVLVAILRLYGEVINGAQTIFHYCSIHFLVLIAGFVR